MRITHSLRTSAALLLAALGTVLVSSGCPGIASTADGRSEMVSALQAAGPDPSLGERARTLRQLIGAWDIEYTDYLKNGEVLQRTGELFFGWVMDGRAVQDVWVVDPWGTHKEREVYTGLTYFDPKSGTWPAIFFDPQIAAIATFTGGPDGDDRVVHESVDLVAGQIRRWSFGDIQTGAPVFRDEASTDGGKTWALKSLYHLKRRSGAGVL